MQLELLLNTALLPGGLALVIAFIGGYTSLAAGAPLAVTAACWLGLSLVSGATVWWPDRAIEHSLWLPALALILTLLPARVGPLPRSGLFLLGWAGILVLIYHPLLSHWGGIWLAIQWIVPLGGTWLLGYGTRASHWQGLAAILPLVVLAPVVGIGGSLLIGQTAGVFAAALGAVWLLATVQQRSRLPDWGLLAIGSAATLAMIAYHYAEVSPLALALAFLPTLVSRLGARAAIPAGWPLWLTTLATAAVSMGVALWWIWPEASLY